MTNAPSGALISLSLIQTDVGKVADKQKANSNSVIASLIGYCLTVSARSGAR